MRTEDGAPVFVDPTLYALALRLPLKDCLQRGVRCAPRLWQRSWHRSSPGRQ